MPLPIRSVFVSSTGKDLADYRKAVAEAIEAMDGYHCVRMENFGARDWESEDFCRAKVRECDLFVGIIGLYFGSAPQGSTKSFTMIEYDTAVAAKKPRLIFLTPDDFRLPEGLRESEDNQQHQKDFRQRLSRERVRGTFVSPNDLALQVVQAIRNWEREQSRRLSITMWFRTLLGKFGQFQVTVKQICEIRRPTHSTDYKPDERQRYMNPSYKLRQSVVMRIGLQNLTEKPVLLGAFSVYLVFEPQDFWKRLRRGDNFGDPYAIVLSYPPGWGVSIILPGELDTSDFMKTLLALYDSESGNPLPLLKPFEFAPRSAERMWDLTVVLPDYVAYVLAREGKHISRAGIAIQLPTGKEVRAEAKLAEYQIAAVGSRSKQLVERTLSEALGTVTDIMQNPELDIGTKVQLLMKKLDNDQERKNALQALATLGEPAIELLVQRMECGSWKDDIQDNSWRYEIADALATIGPAASLRLIQTLVYHKNYWVRMAALQALEKIKDPHAVEPLIGVLELDVACAPNWAAQILATIGDPRAIPSLAKAFARNFRTETQHNPVPDISRALDTLCAQPDVPQAFLQEAVKILQEHGLENYAQRLMAGKPLTDNKRFPGMYWEGDK